MLRSYHVVTLTMLALVMVIYSFHQHNMFAGCFGIPNPNESQSGITQNFLDTTKSTVTEINAVVARRAPLAFSRAFYVDLPILLSFFPVGPSLFKRLAVAVLFYEIRQDTKAIWLAYGLEEVPASIAAGIAGGVVKNSMLGMDETIGSFSTITYEVCGCFEWCYNDPFINTRLILVVEILDAMSHAYLQGTATVASGAYTGLKIGALAAANTYTFLLPALEAAKV